MTTHEWRPLFDGQSTRGWHRYNAPGEIGAGWRVQDGTLHFDPSVPNGGGDIVTDEDFGDFHLRLEWKLAPGGNSGVFFHVQEAPQYSHTYLTGPEMQILDNDRHADAKLHKHRAGDLYDLIASSQDAAKPVGEWNAVEIIAANGTLTFKLNDVVTVHTTLWDEHWRGLVSQSKFKDWPGFGASKRGRIGLQDHGDPAWFRNIAVRAL